MTFSCPPCTWDRTAPMPVLLVSVSRMNGLLGIEKANTVVVVNAAFMLLKASSLSLDHVNSLPSSVSLWSGLAIPANPRMNRLYYEQRPRKLLTSFVVLGWGQSCTASIFRGQLTLHFHSQHGQGRTRTSVAGNIFWDQASIWYREPFGILCKA